MQMTSVKKLQKDVSRFTTSQSTYAFLFFCFRQLKKKMRKRKRSSKTSSLPSFSFLKTKQLSNTIKNDHITKKDVQKLLNTIGFGVTCAYYF